MGILLYRSQKNKSSKQTLEGFQVRMQREAIQYHKAFLVQDPISDIFSIFGDFKHLTMDQWTLKQYVKFMNIEM